jgi:hypothetical protein
VVASTKRLDPRKTSLARPSSIYKRQTCPLVREGARHRKYERLKLGVGQAYDRSAD